MLYTLCQHPATFELVYVYEHVPAPRQNVIAGINSHALLWIVSDIFATLHPRRSELD